MAKATELDARFFEELLRISRCDVRYRTRRCEEAAFIALVENRKHLCTSHWDDLVVGIAVYHRIQETLAIANVPRTQPGVAG